MQVIEKVKVVPEGYNGAGMNYDGAPTAFQAWEKSCEDTLAL